MNSCLTWRNDAQQRFTSITEVCTASTHNYALRPLSSDILGKAKAFPKMSLYVIIKKTPRCHTVRKEVINFMTSANQLEEVT